MYRIVYHETALTDMKEIVSYISHELNNPAAAVKLITEMIEAGDSLAVFPYKYQVYVPLRISNINIAVSGHEMIIYFTGSMKRIILLMLPEAFISPRVLLRQISR